MEAALFCCLEDYILIKIILLFLIVHSIISMKSITNMKNTKNYTEEIMEKDKYVGISKVGEKGQIVIPKEARDMFDIKPGDSIIVLCDKEKGIALVKSDVIEDLTDKILP